MNMERFLGSAPVSGMWDRATEGRLRVLAYHQVPDPDLFAAHLDLIVDRYNAVTGRQVADSLTAGPPLPPRPLWITFDDGDLSVVRHALPLLSARGLPATAFVCAGWIGSDEMPWWDVVDLAFEAEAVRPDDLGTTDRLTLLRLLKQMPDQQRRDLVGEWSTRCESAGTATASEQWSVDDLHEWVDAGNEVGNHSWDHPCLIRCAPDEQARQVTDSHVRLTELLGATPDLFAWPNGDPSRPALEALRELDYRLVLGFDHRVCGRKIDASAVPRLRIDSNVTVPRAHAIMSGVHASVFHLSHRMKRGGADDSR